MLQKCQKEAHFILLSRIVFSISISCAFLLNNPYPKSHIITHPLVVFFVQTQHQQRMPRQGVLIIFSATKAARALIQVAANVLGITPDRASDCVSPA